MFAEFEPDGECFARPGIDNVIFLGQNGREQELQKALKHFRVGERYVVAETDIGNWSSTYKIKGVAGTWNTVMFRVAVSETTLDDAKRNLKYAWTDYESMSQGGIDQTAVVNLITQAAAVLKLCDRIHGDTAVTTIMLDD
jgi:hypothetical protein